MTATVYGARVSSHRPQLIGGAFGDLVLPSPAGSSDLSRWCQPENQGQTEKCVGEAMAAGFWLANRNTGRKPSPKGIYTDARVRERSRVTDPLPDFGCDPADAVDACILVGPYPEDAYESDMSRKDATATFAEQSRRIRVDPSFIVEVDPGDLDTLDRYLSITDGSGAPAGYGFVFAMQVDQSFEDWTGDGIYQGPTGPSLGGHAQLGCGHDMTGGWYLVCGSWGPGLGSRGFVKIGREFIRTKASNLYVIRGAPTWS